jgi:hypothetical protein
LAAIALTKIFLSLLQELSNSCLWHTTLIGLSNSDAGKQVDQPLSQLLSIYTYCRSVFVWCSPPHQSWWQIAWSTGHTDDD